MKSETINGEKYEYKYDAHSNITDVTKDGVLQYHYGYDMMNQLVSVDDKLNGKVCNYTYDAGGNLISETVTDSNGTTSNAYEYNNSNWGDVLTSYNDQNITHDEIGNPLTYRDGMSMTWKNGRQLATLTNGDTSISYGYDSGSVRTTKTVNGVKYTYAYLNGQLLYETRGDAKFYYSYDANGILYNVRYTLTDGGTEYSYYYTHNSHGDIVGIYNGAGELKAHYEYDAWGNVISITDINGNAITSPNHIGNLNPFRYRGYYQDTETGLYYLMSRYYDPITHRFINADGYFQSGGSILDANTFAYCANNPVTRSDESGNSWFHKVMTAILNGVKKATAAVTSTINSVSSEKHKTSNVKIDFSTTAPTIGYLASKGTTHAVSSSAVRYVSNYPKPSSVGVGTYKKTVNNQIRDIHNVTSYVNNTIDMIDNTLTVGGIIYDTGYGIYENVKCGASGYDIAHDILVDFACSSLPALLGCAGTVFGPVGTVVGTFVGGVLTVCFDGVPFGGCDSFRTWLKEN